MGFDAQGTRAACRPDLWRASGSDALGAGSYSGVGMFRGAGGRWALTRKARGPRAVQICGGRRAPTPWVRGVTLASSNSLALRMACHYHERMKTEDTAHDVKPMRTVLTIAGSDSGGGAGIQADLKTFTSLGLFGTSVVTCLTAQNPDRVSGIMPVDALFVAKQIEAVCDSFPIFAMKTGMLYSPEIVRVVADEDIYEGIAVLVVDPVMSAASGARLEKDNTLEAICRELLPLARVLTPNIQEAEAIWGNTISSQEDMRRAACDIGDRYDVACVVKGGHLSGDEVVDVLYDEGEEFIYSSYRVDAKQTHGAGCAFSAALTAFLAQRRLLCDAVDLAKEYVVRALEGARPTGPHTPLNFEAAAALMAHVKE